MLRKTHLYDTWFAAGIAPASFGTANVQCLRKSAGASRPLDHRPIALLNSDYKIYMKIFATRMRRLLPTLVGPAQAGFVPGRVIATAIDTLHAAQLTATMNADQVESIALLLGVAKAYDSLHRPYMLQALRWHGLPDRFANMVATLHASTSSQFVVNGFLSRPIAVTCGIRQGCPLAPLLFILTLDPLHRTFRASTLLRGIVLSTDEHSAEIRTCGYADNTAVYLRDADQIEPALRILDSFTTASGLAINRTKSIILPLSTRSTTEQTSLHGLRILGPDEHCRYFGI